MFAKAIARNFSWPIEEFYACTKTRPRHVRQYQYQAYVYAGMAGRGSSPDSAEQHRGVCGSPLNRTTSKHTDVCMRHILQWPHSALSGDYPSPAFANVWPAETPLLVPPRTLCFVGRELNKTLCESVEWADAELFLILWDITSPTTLHL